jgi:hypothetical protein
LLLREDVLAGKLAWLRSHLIVRSLCHRTKERLPDTSAVIFNKRQIATAITEIIEGLLESRTAPVVVQGCTIGHPDLRLWLWFGLRFRFRFRLRLRLGLWFRCRAI